LDRRPFGLTGNQDHLALADLCLSPAPKQQLRFFISPYKGVMLAACSALKRLSTALSYLGSTAAVLSSPQNLRQTAKMMAIRC
jgi:hypothetical protein